MNDRFVIKDKILFTFFITDFVFLLTGGLMLGFALISQDDLSQPPEIGDSGRILFLRDLPLGAAVPNAILIFLTFLLSVPGLIIPTSRTWLKVHGHMVVVCALYTLILGLTIWFRTLRVRSNLAGMWEGLSDDFKGAIEQEFSCCGFTLPTTLTMSSQNTTTTTNFTPTPLCTNILTATSLGSCANPVASAHNSFLDLVFTAAFGIVGIDGVLVLATAMLLKERRERSRYQAIEEKCGIGGF